LISFFVILGKIPGGWDHVAAISAGKFQVFDFGLSWTKPYTFWAGVIGGCFLTTASHGTEQLLVQRLLAAPTERQGRAALLASWVVIFIQFTLFLIIGVCLYTFYKDYGLAAPDSSDKIYPLFIWQHLPVGISGLVIAAILAAAMSNLSAALNSLASTTVMDFWKPLAGGSGDDSRWLLRARYATVAWAAVLFGVGLIARQWGSVLQAGLSIASIIYGASGRDRGDDWHAGGIGCDAVCSICDSGRVHVVRADRDVGDFSNGARHVLDRKGEQCSKILSCAEPWGSGPRLQS
jgi:Na+/proline symporter